MDIYTSHVSMDMDMGTVFGWVLSMDMDMGTVFGWVCFLGLAS